MRLFDPAGNRLYLTAQERRDFLAAAKAQEPKLRTFCETLHWTGGRISEALEIIPRRVELDAGEITLRALKKRRKDVYRAAPVPPEYWTPFGYGFRAQACPEAHHRRRQAPMGLEPPARLEDHQGRDGRGRHRGRPA